MFRNLLAYYPLLSYGEVEKQDWSCSSTEKTKNTGGYKPKISSYNCSCSRVRRGEAQHDRTGSRISPHTDSGGNRGAGETERCDTVASRAADAR